VETVDLGCILYRFTVSRTNPIKTDGKGVSMNDKIRNFLCLFLVFHLIFPPFLLAKERLAVMSLKTQNPKQQWLADTISVEIRNEIHKLEIFEVVSQEDIDALAVRSASLQKLGCEDNQCLITFGNQLGSRFMVAGTMAKLKEKYHIGIRLLDTGGGDAGVKARTSRDCSCTEGELLKVARVLSVKLLRNYYKGSVNSKPKNSEIAKVHSRQLANMEKSLEVVKEENIIDEDRSFFWQYKWWLLGAAVILAGGAAAAGGGGGGGSSGADNPDQPAETETGNLSFGW